MFAAYPPDTCARAYQHQVPFFLVPCDLQPSRFNLISAYATAFSPYFLIPQTLVPTNSVLTILSLFHPLINLRLRPLALWSTESWQLPSLIPLATSTPTARMPADVWYLLPPPFRHLPTRHTLTFYAVSTSRGTHSSNVQPSSQEQGFACINRRGGGGTHEH